MTARCSGLDASSQTRLGAVSASLPQAASVLRARAASAGLVLRPSSEVDLAAAVVAAESWAQLVNASSLASPAQYGPEALVVLGAVLRRAAGHVSSCAEFEADGCAVDPALLAAASSHARWAVHLLGPLAADALRRAAADLASAGPRSRFAAFAELLVLTSDDVADL